MESVAIWTVVLILVIVNTVYGELTLQSTPLFISQANLHVCQTSLSTAHYEEAHAIQYMEIF